MNLKQGSAFIFSLIGLLLILNGCTVQQEITIRTDGSGNGEFHLELSETVMELVAMQAPMLGDENLKIIDTEKINEGFEEVPAIMLTEVISPDETRLDGAFDFTNISEIFSYKKELSDAGAISFTQSDGLNRLEVNLNVDNFQQVAEILKLNENPFYEFFGPHTNTGMSDDEFKEMMSLMLGDAGIASLSESVVELKVNVEGEILESNGMISRNPDYVTFEIPLIRFFVMNEEINLYLEFQ